MEKLAKILNLILETSEKNIDNDEKHNLLSELWTKYYKLAKELNVSTNEAYNINLITEENSFIVNQESVNNIMNYEMLSNSVDKIKNNIPLSLEEAKNILNWTVFNTKRNLSTILNSLNLDVNKCSLTGFCEVSQALSLMPLESIGLNVTKNRAQDCFEYPYNHVFGTVTFQISENSKTVNKTYLIDITYRQFFKTNKCNEGIYYIEDEYGDNAVPDPGYFADKEFAKKLLKDGYIELTEETAKLYGLPFFKSSLDINNKEKKCNIDFYNNIMNNTFIYSAYDTDLEGFDFEFPHYKSRL